MTLAGVDGDGVAARLVLIRPFLDERAWRLLLGAEATVLGRGGIKLVAAATGAHPDTVAAGVRELAGEDPMPGRVRRPGAGRPSKAVTDPDLAAALDALVDPESRGDPGSPLRWTIKSTAKLASELSAQGHPVSARTVAKMLVAEGYSLQANVKTVEGAHHPDRDAQFRYLNGQVGVFQAGGDPVISVDTKKKELVGNFKAAGREWAPAGHPPEVNVHDFADKDLGKVAPYGVYDLTANTGWVNVGTDADTGAFAVESIRRWWTSEGTANYPGASRLLITADSGGSNGSRLRLWKTELAAFATETGLDITVCHLPPGTSKWNKIEHRLFSAITGNWRGRPLQSHEVVIETIRATTTSTGLTVNAVLDTNTYPPGIKITNQQMAALEDTQLRRHEFHGDWNYTLTAEHTTTHSPSPV
jgi:Rhodopirellula transposase DDE domain